MQSHLHDLLERANFLIDAAALVLDAALEAATAPVSGIASGGSSVLSLLPCLAHRPAYMGVLSHWLMTCIARPFASLIPKIVRDAYECIGEDAPASCGGIIDEVGERKKGVTMPHL